METDSIIVGFLLFFSAEFFKIIINMYWKDDSKDKKEKKEPMPAFWEMSASDLKKIAEQQGLGREVKLKQDIIAELVELSR